VFRNELFQIGGYRLLRGFNEESIYASRYTVFSAEYRYLVGLNSYLFVFTDVGFVRNQYQAVNTSNNFTGAGMGILFETRAGLLNISYAAGKRDDVKFNLREASKLHFGYINYF
jgi:outer membrane protein assembly factor BamA